MATVSERDVYRLWQTLKPYSHLLKLESGKTKSIRLADIVLVGDRSCGCVSLLDRRGRSTEIHTDDWKDSKKLRRKLLSMFPTEIIRDFPEE